jgi:hypothetical protein
LARIKKYESTREEEFDMRKLMVYFLSTALVLLGVAPQAFEQEKTKLPKQNGYSKVITESPAAAEAVRSAVANGNAAPDKKKNPQLEVFTYNVTASRDGNTYSGVIVGKSPFNDPGGETSIPTQIIPIVITTNANFAGVDANGNILVTPGATTINPTANDNNCLSAPFNNPLALTQQSPIFRKADFNFGGTDIGKVQTTDAFQRGNFFQLVGGSGHEGDHQGDGGNNGFDYHVDLDPVTTVAPITINVPATLGVAYPSVAFGGCANGTVQIFDFSFFDSVVTGTILPAVQAQGLVNPGSFPLFLLYNGVMCEGPNCAVLAPGTACCVLGYHSHSGTQTFGTAEFDTSNIFLSPVPDVVVMSHEVGEWMNNPFNSNSVPAWGHIGQQPGCQGNLEVGDPLSGTQAPRIRMPNGYTYHMQELAFFSWFFGAPSLGVNGWFSDDATFLTDAGPVCK